MSRQYFEAANDECHELVLRFGGPVSYVLADPRCQRFTTPVTAGVIPYRQAPRCRVAIGDPVAEAPLKPRLMEQFAEASRAAGQRAVFAAASAELARHAVEIGYGALQWGEEVVVDPREDLTAGSAGRELRKKVNRAHRAGVVVHEHGAADPPSIEDGIRRAAAEWRAARTGPQVFIAPIHRIGSSRGRRCFYAVAGNQIVGVLSLVRVEPRNGWAVEHMLRSPSAPPGTSELLVVRSLRIVGEEGSEHATFGPAVLPRLDHTHGIGKVSEWLAKLVFRLAERTFRVGSIMRYREKFGVVRKEPSYLLFPTSKVGPVEVYGLIHAFTAH